MDEKMTVKRSKVTEKVVMLPMKVSVQWEGDQCVMVLPGWRLPVGRFIACRESEDEALKLLSSILRDYWG